MMIGIIRTKLRLFIRNPWLFLIMTFICVLFAYFVGKSSYSKIYVPVFSDLSEQEMGALLTELNESDLFEFEHVSKQEARDAIQNGKVEAGLEARAEDFSLIMTAHSENATLLEQYVQTIYMKKIQKAHLLSLTDNKEKVEQIWQTAHAKPLFGLKKENFRNDQSRVIDNQLQGIFGFSLFFVIYTIAFNVIHILEEKRARIWDRMTVSSVTKWEMYVGNLLYSFLMGYFQVVLVFVAFRYGAGVDFHGGFGKTLLLLIPYVLSIVALCMMLAAFSKTLSQFNGLVPLFSVSLAMLGGAYWPIEIVSSPIMLAIGKISPLLYGMEALKGATLYGYGFTDLLQPISILLLMAVVMMGIGINVMERRRV